MNDCFFITVSNVCLFFTPVSVQSCDFPLREFEDLRIPEKIRCVLQHPDLPAVPSLLI